MAFSRNERVEITLQGCGFSSVTLNARWSYSDLNAAGTEVATEKLLTPEENRSPFMRSLADPETLWLSLTNILLGAVTLVCLVAALSAVIRELIRRRQSRRRNQGHSFVLPGLGITMADGGTRVADESPRKKKYGRVLRTRN